MMEDRLKTRPAVIQLPIGAEETFRGVVDLVKGKAIVWDDTTMGAKYQVEEVPDAMKAEVKEYRDKLIETASDFDEKLMRSISTALPVTVEEIMAALRKGTISMGITPVLCGASFKNQRHTTPS